MKILQIPPKETDIVVRSIRYNDLTSFIDNELKLGQKDNDDLLYIEPEHSRLKDAYGLLEYCGVYVANAIVGYLAYSLKNPLHLDKLYITPKARGLGIGEIVIKDCGFRSVFVNTENHRAISFYKKCGFEIEKTIGNQHHLKR